MGTSDLGYDAGTYVDELAELNGKLHKAWEDLERVYADRDKVIQRWNGALTELNDLHDVLAAGLGYPRYRDTEEPPGGYPDSPDAYVTGDHTTVTLAMKAMHELAAEHSSRQAWAAEAMDLTNRSQSLDWLIVFGEEHRDFPRVCVCVSDEQANHLANAGFSRPQCAVHPEVNDGG